MLRASLDGRGVPRLCCSSSSEQPAKHPPHAGRSLTAPSPLRSVLKPTLASSKLSAFPTSQTRECPAHVRHVPWQHPRADAKTPDSRYFRCLMFELKYSRLESGFSFSTWKQSNCAQIVVRARSRREAERVSRPGQLFKLRDWGWNLWHSDGPPRKGSPESTVAMPYSVVLPCTSNAIAGVPILSSRVWCGSVSVFLSCSSRRRFSCSMIKARL